MSGFRLWQQIVAPLQQWLLEQGRCVACGTLLSHRRKEAVRGNEVIACSCGESYLYLPKANLFKRLTPNKYV
ncbi:MAG TPA: hypothetical protein VMW04_04620 [Patescibacteria group bacterium]|nr:hypothetical protein [Patescibacteria group bacterium]